MYACSVAVSFGYLLAQFSAMCVASFALLVAGYALAKFERVIADAVLRATVFLRWCAVGCPDFSNRLYRVIITTLVIQIAVAIIARMAVMQLILIITNGIINIGNANGSVNISNDVSRINNTSNNTDIDHIQDPNGNTEDASQNESRPTTATTTITTATR